MIAARAAGMGVASAFIGGAALAGAQFSELERVCLKTHADPLAVLSAADASGWSPTPANDSGRQDDLSRVKTTKTAKLTLTVEETAAADGTFNRVCTLTSTPADAAIFADAAAWAKVRPLATDAEIVGYGFIERDGQHLDSQKPGDLPSDFDVHSHLRYLGVIAKRGQSTAIYTASVKSPN